MTPRVYCFARRVKIVFAALLLARLVAKKQKKNKERKNVKGRRVSARDGGNHTDAIRASVVR